jgi:small-conductance mechanosensitive channel
MQNTGFYVPYAATFLEEHREQVYALVTVVLAFAIAQLVDRALSRRAERVSARVAGGELSAVATTRLRLVRRLIYAGIIVIGLALALAQFEAARRLAAGILASSAVLGLIVGFAARATLANAIAGVMLAITQPIRIGDLVTVEDQTGEVEDVNLSYTYVRLDDGSRLVVPNERLAQSSVENHTVVDPRVQVEVSVWIPPGADAERAIGAIASEDDGVSATVAEVERDGVRLSATTWADGPRERGRVAAELRRRWLRLLREQGLSSAGAS